MTSTPFSKRQGYRGASLEITIREAAPDSLRMEVLESAVHLAFGPSALRSVVCRVLRVRPEPSNWSEYPNVWGEVEYLVYGCEWFRVYDIIEAIYAAMRESDDRRNVPDGTATKFAEKINEFLVDEGIGWQLVEGQVVTRGAEGFESVVTDAGAALAQSGRPTAAGHVHDALQALSRRPTPDSAAAIYHAMGALECVARDLTGDEKATLGEILKQHPDLLPKPLDAALAKVWGYASNEARHVVEGRDPNRQDAELVVGLAASVATYLTRKGGP